MSRPKTTVGVVKFASCDGCQLSILDLENELLAIADAFHIIEFPEATSRRSAGPYDVLFVEGSISTPEQLDEIRELRSQCRLLVTIGACATTGGIQALRNWADGGEWQHAVYPNTDYVNSLATATPIANHVKVDAELHGCPISQAQLSEFLTAVVVGRRPQVPDESVCRKCKQRGNVCVMVAQDTPCLGPVTMTGCGAICPSYDRGCYACFGPKERANADSLTSWLIDAGHEEKNVRRLFEGFTAYAKPFRQEVSLGLGKKPKSGPHQPTAGDSHARN